MRHSAFRETANNGIDNSVNKLLLSAFRRMAIVLPFIFLENVLPFYPRVNWCSNDKLLRKLGHKSFYEIEP